MRSSQVEIESPCHESWDTMEGDGERRFCGVCEKHVHNLSAMRHDDAQALLAATAGERLCVRYAVEADGALRFRDLVPKSRLTRGLRRAAFAAALLAGCSPQGNEPIAGLADVAAASIREHTVSTPDGGCNVTTGPFTTFHFPPGHALCGPADPANTGVTPVVAAPVVVAEQAVATPPVVAVPVRVDPLPEPFPGAGAPEPAPTVALRAPNIRMGAAVAQPEPVDPFLPCDPDPRFAPPPPPAHGFAPPPPPRGFAPPPPPRGVAPPEPTRQLMGDIAVREPEPMMQGGLRPRDM